MVVVGAVMGILRERFESAAVGEQDVVEVFVADGVFSEVAEKVAVDLLTTVEAGNNSEAWSLATSLI